MFTGENLPFYGIYRVSFTVVLLFFVIFSFLVSESLDELTAIVVDRFSEIRNHNVDMKPPAKLPFRAEDLGVREYYGAPLLLGVATCCLNVLFRV